MAVQTGDLSTALASSRQTLRNETAYKHICFSVVIEEH